jgi:kynurenine 3-monooxygenase
MISFLAKQKKICVIGSGLVGTLLAILLTEAGFDVDVYEKRKDPRKESGNGHGRTIALSLSDRGWKALRSVGLEEAVLKNTNPAYGRMVYEADGATHLQDYGDGSQAIHTVNRSWLNIALLKRAMTTRHATFYFEHAAESIDEKTGDVVFTNLASNEKVTERYDHIIGVDGVFSMVRAALSKKDRWAFESSILDFGYKELRINPNTPGAYPLADHRVHVWPRKNSVIIAFPTTDDYFAATLFFPVLGENSLATITDTKKLRSFMEREYGDVIPYIPNLESDFFYNPDSILTQVKGWPWHYEDKVLLMGDACHAITPFYGMGMNIGFEDCTVFMEILKKNNYDVGMTFASFDVVRKPDTDAMFDFSYKNFRSLNESPDPEYNTKWLLERRIWKLFPQKWMPGYVRIVFSETPIGELPPIQKKQDHLLAVLMADHPNAMDLPDEELRAAVKPLLAQFF